MRICFLGPFGFHPNKTMRSRALPLARQLVLRGHQVKIVMPPWQTPAEAGKRWQEDGIDIEYVKLSGGIPLTVLRMVQSCAMFAPHIVHAFKPKAHSGLAAWWLWYPGLISSGRGTQLLVDTDDWEGAGGWNDRANYSRLQKRFFAWQEKWGLTHAHHITVASRTLESITLSLGVPPEQLSYIPNGPGIGRPTPDGREESRQKLGLGERPTLLLYSRLFEFDIERLVEFLSGVRDQIPQLAILSIGSGLFAEDAADLRQRFEKAGLLDHVIDLGWQAESDLPNLVAAADCGIYMMDDNLLNRTKCPVKLADMVAAGLPMVAEDVGQVGQYIAHQQNGLLRTSGDTNGLITDCVSILESPDLRQSFASAAITRFEQKFSWHPQANQLLAVYQKLLNRTNT